jgi:hypothetical protein
MNTKTDSTYLLTTHTVTSSKKMIQQMHNKGYQEL